MNGRAATLAPNTPTFNRYIHLALPEFASGGAMRPADACAPIYVRVSRNAALKANVAAKIPQVSAPHTLLPAVARLCRL